MGDRETAKRLAEAIRNAPQNVEIGNISSVDADGTVNVQGKTRSRNAIALEKSAIGRGIAFEEGGLWKALPFNKQTGDDSTSYLANTRSRRQPERKRGKLLILFAQIIEGERVYFVGGDRKTPIRVFSTPAAEPIPSFQFSATGGGNFIFSTKTNDAIETKGQLSGSYAEEGIDLRDFAPMGHGYWGIYNNIPSPDLGVRQNLSNAEQGQNAAAIAFNLDGSPGLVYSLQGNYYPNTGSDTVIRRNTARFSSTSFDRSGFLLGTSLETFPISHEVNNSLDEETRALEDTFIAEDSESFDTVFEVWAHFEKLRGNGATQADFKLTESLQFLASGQSSLIEDSRLGSVTQGEGSPPYIGEIVEGDWRENRQEGFNYSGYVRKARVGKSGTSGLFLVEEKSSQTQEALDNIAGSFFSRNVETLKTVYQLRTDGEVVELLATETTTTTENSNQQEATQPAPHGQFESAESAKNVIEALFDLSRSNLVGKAFYYLENPLPQQLEKKGRLSVRKLDFSGKGSARKLTPEYIGIPAEAQILAAQYHP